MKRQWAAVTGLAILAIAGVEVYALSQGINGTALTAAIAGVAGLGGASISRMIK